MSALVARHHLLLQLASRPDGVLVAEAATELALTRGTVNNHLRRLERAGHVLADVIGGGRRCYSFTAAGWTGVSGAAVEATA